MRLCVCCIMYIYISYILYELDEMDGSWGYIELGLFQSMSSAIWLYYITYMYRLYS